ncbi:hypothetical protein DPMN_027955 [Dreissena polymorpha]|uniref:Uncharacterized protein n=1 Tax=Dreissena polymorpha TaxID=45954 RepID=A0A9D4LTT8_DREPO|nr:hypothetical protein DPMN_027955 [Dreissena polymorpha]
MCPMSWRPADDRTVNGTFFIIGLRPTSDSLYVSHDKLRPASVSHRVEGFRPPDGRRPMYISLGNTSIFADTRTMNQMSGVDRPICFRFQFDSIPGPTSGKSLSETNN